MTDCRSSAVAVILGGGTVLNLVSEKNFENQSTLVKVMKKIQLGCWLLEHVELAVVTV